MSPSQNPSLNYIGKVSSPFKVVTHSEVPGLGHRHCRRQCLPTLHVVPYGCRVGCLGAAHDEDEEVGRYEDVKILPLHNFFLALSTQIRLLLNAW